MIVVLRGLFLHFLGWGGEWGVCALAGQLNWYRCVNKKTERKGFFKLDSAQRCHHLG